jgi:hypothetical protein
MKHFLYTLLLLLTLSSCNDWLEVRPRTEVAVDELFVDEAGFKDALTACYLKLNGTELYGEYLIVSHIEYLAQHWNVANVAAIKNFQYEIASVQSTFASIYSAQYNVIAQANILLENLAAWGGVIEKETLRGIIEAEALAIRGFCHFEILRLFGQVPNNAHNLVSLPYVETVGLDPIPYYTYDDFLARVLRDWDAAEKLLEKYDPVLEYSYEQLNTLGSTVTLEDDFLGYRRFRFNYYAVKALKARLYLYVGQREKAYALAKELIDARDPAGNKVLSLAGANDLNRQYYALPSECFLALHNLQLSALAEWISFSYYLTVPMFNDLFAGQSTSVNNRATVVWDATHTLLNTITPILRKYNQPGIADAVTGITLATQRQVVPLIRLSEIYLIAMETSTDLAEVNALYAEYMAARNVMAPPLTEAQVAGEILNEYRREFFGEGQMFYTYKRLGTTRLLWKTDRDVTEVDYVVPLPASEYDETSDTNIQ